MTCLRRIAHIVQDEHGGINMYMTLSLILVITSIPFFWDVASVHYTRRMAGTGADAAALAAAQEFIRPLQHVFGFNGPFLGSCSRREFKPELVLLRYITHPNFNAPAEVSQALALSYATNNRNDLTSFRAWIDLDGAPELFGIPIPMIKVAVGTERPVHTAYGPVYRRSFHVPNEAQAAAYLNFFTVTPRYCGSGDWTFDFTLEWKITLMTSEREAPEECIPPPPPPTAHPQSRGFLGIPTQPTPTPTPAGAPFTRSEPIPEPTPIPQRPPGC
ncbi:MAG: pilus assembly protein TadG-related protein [Chloroflexales bacterium]|nr:pilus assembly protein TadG-related protein [Chloroflexales bacterium]